MFSRDFSKYLDAMAIERQSTSNIKSSDAERTKARSTLKQKNSFFIHGFCGFFARETFPEKLFRDAPNDNKYFSATQNEQNNDVCCVITVLGHNKTIVFLENKRKSLGCIKLLAKKGLMLVFGAADVA